MPATRSADDAGFSIVESLIALGLVFGVMVGLLATVNIGIRGIVTGRQRSVAVSIANEVMEAARNRSYGDVGHDFDSDPTLAGDTALQGTAPNLFFTDLSPGPNEPLVGSVVDAGSQVNALFPFSPHRWTTVREATTYTTSVYVTRVVPTSGDPYRRLTVIVTWDRSLHAAAVPASVRLSSFLFNAIQPPDPLFVGLAEADAGTVTVTGTLVGIDLSHAGLWFPYAHGEIDSRFVRRATGFAGTTRSILEVKSGTATGCTPSADGRTAECSGAKVETGSDNDAATAPLDHNAVGPTSDGGGNLSAGGSLFSYLGLGTAKSLSTARCLACSGTGVDDNDRLPYQRGEATGPASLSMPFSAGAANGSLLTTGAACSTCSTVELDREDVSGVSRLVTTAGVSHPAIDLVTFNGAPGFSGMVRIGSTSVTTSATSGPGALAPTASGNAVNVQVYDTALGGYRTMSIIPGTPSEDVSSAVMAVGATSATMTATIRSGPAVTLSTVSDEGARTEAQASLSNWLTVEVHLVIKETPASLESVADLVITLDYGRVTSRATYQPAPA